MCCFFFMHQGAMAASPQSFNPARENRRAAALFNNRVDATAITILFDFGHLRAAHHPMRWATI
jgi:hypothetical protein